MRHHGLTLGLLFTVSTAAACSDSNSGTSGTGGSAGQTTSTGGSANGTGGSSATGGSSSSGGTKAAQEVVCVDKPSLPNVAAWGARGKATVNATSFDGYEEYYLLSDGGFGTEICVVRFDLKRVGDAPAGCPDCVWSHMVEFSNPKTMLDEKGVCANSGLGLDAARIASITGSRVSYGFVSEFVGHNSVRMQYDDAKKMWDARGNATYEASSGTFNVDSRNGECRYGD
jgi:hypothetical protein